MNPSDSTPAPADGVEPPVEHDAVVVGHDAVVVERDALVVEHDALVRMVAACLASGLITVAEVNERTEDEVRALINARSRYQVADLNGSGLAS